MEEAGTFVDYSIRVRVGAGLQGLDQRIVVLLLLDFLHASMPVHNHVPIQVTVALAVGLALIFEIFVLGKPIL